MSPDAIIFAVTSAVAAGVVLYIVWSSRHYQEESERKRDQQNLLWEIQRDIDRQQAAVLARCTELQHKLEDHGRTLKYLARRLS